MRRRTLSMRPELPPSHGQELEITVAVRVDFAAEADFFNFRSFPCHGCILPQ